jgi:hypothetical protein
MATYTRYVRRNIYYYPMLRPWYRLLDWWQNGAGDRIMTSRTVRFGMWFLPRFLRVVFILAKILGGLIFVVGMAVFYLFISTTLKGLSKR